MPFFAFLSSIPPTSDISLFNFFPIVSKGTIDNLSRPVTETWLKSFKTPAASFMPPILDIPEVSFIDGIASVATLIVGSCVLGVILPFIVINVPSISLRYSLLLNVIIKSLYFIYL